MLNINFFNMFGTNCLTSCLCCGFSLLLPSDNDAVPMLVCKELNGKPSKCLFGPFHSSLLRLFCKGESGPFRLSLPLRRWGYQLRKHAKNGKTLRIFEMFLQKRKLTVWTGRKLGRNHFRQSRRYDVLPCFCPCCCSVPCCLEERLIPWRGLVLRQQKQPPENPMWKKVPPGKRKND